jgi:hypothetical protein
MRSSLPSNSAIFPNWAAQMRVAFSSIAPKTGFKSPGDELMTLRTSEAAESCSKASSRSRLSSAFSVLVLALEGLRRPLTFGALGRLSVAAFRRRVLIGLPPALERRRIATPMAQDKAS